MIVDAPPDPLAALLERIRAYFGVRAAAIRARDEQGRPTEIRAGAPFPDSETPAMRRFEARAAEDRVVLPAIEAPDEGGPPDPGALRLRFYAGIPLAIAGGPSFGTLSLFHPEPVLLSGAKLSFFEELGSALAPLAARRPTPRDAIVRWPGTALDRATFELAASGARIGLWECALRDESLTWTDQVYDLFEIPIGTALVRDRILDCYTEPSLRLLARTRRAALEARRGFRLDAEIVTMRGRRRWIRINAGIDCRDGAPVRLVGMKQDITQERLRLDGLRHRAEFDALTGLANRARFEARLADLGSGRAPAGALLLIDLDGFKQVNDGFGHAAGDACLKAAAGRLAAICGAADLVARIGGDEFAVVLDPRHDAPAAQALAEAIVGALRQPILREGRAYRLGASVGIAQAAGARTPAELCRQADIALYAAKAAGRGTVRIFHDPATGHVAAAGPPIRTPDLARLASG